jgi:hypothetical protein
MPAQADESEDGLVKRGTEAFARRDYDGARAVLEQAYALRPRTATLLKLALAELQCGRFVPAAKHLREYVGHDDAPASALEAVRSRWLPQAESHTARLAVKAPAEVEVLVDGTVEGRGPLEGVVLGEGSHVVAFRLGAVTQTQVVVGKAGEVVNAEFVPPPQAPVEDRPAAAERALVVPAPVEEPTLPESGASGAKWITVIGLGTGALGTLGMGLAFGIASNNAAAEYRQLYAQLGPDPSACSRPPVPGQCGRLADSYSAANNDHVLSQAFWVTGGVLTVATAATWLLWRPGQRQAGAVQLQPTVGAAGGGVRVAGSW